MENIDDNFYKVVKTEGLRGPITYVASCDSNRYAGFTGITGITGIIGESRINTGPTGPTGPTGHPPSENNSTYDFCNHKHFLYQ